jgi:hypothetical protein
MYGTIQLVMCTDEGREDIVTDVRPLTQDCQRLEHLGSARAAAKPLLTLLPPPLLAQPIDAWLAAHSGGETCGSAFKVTGDPTCTFRADIPQTLEGICVILGVGRISSWEEN